MQLNRNIFAAENVAEISLTSSVTALFRLLTYYLFDAEFKSVVWRCVLLVVFAGFGSKRAIKIKLL